MKGNRSEGNEIEGKRGEGKGELNGPQGDKTSLQGYCAIWSAPLLFACNKVRFSGI